MSKKDVMNLEIPKFKEFNTLFALKSCAQDTTCWTYIPEHWIEVGAKISRRYLWIVLSTVRTEFVRRLIKHAREQRSNDTKDEKADESFTLCTEALQILASTSHIASKSNLI